MRKNKLFSRISAFLISIMLVVSVFALTACTPPEGDNPPVDDKLNIVDDNNRNWYEIFVRSFYDSGDDGIGDLKGVTTKLDYIKEMGYNGIWLMPICESTTYHGYDVIDYYTVERDYGTNDDMKELVSEAHKRGINVIVDMVLNHTSGGNDWFQKATRAIKNNETNTENAKYINYYNFRQSDTKPDGYNLINGTGNWYYESRFDMNMPDLNLDNNAVREEIADILEFWLVDMDCDGFRLDAVTSYYTGNVGKNVEFLSFLNRTSKAIKKDAYIVGECWEGDNIVNNYYESGCDSFFLFSTSAGGEGTIRQIVSSLGSRPGKDYTNLLLRYQNTFKKGSLAPFLGNHDTARAANMLRDENRIKMGAGLLSLMNGNVFVYYGDEIGMTCSDSNSDPTKRVALRWSENEMAIGQVFMPPVKGMVVNPSSYSFGSVETQQKDDESILNYYKAAMRLRNRHPEIARGTIQELSSPDPYVSAFKKTWNGESIIVLVNLNELDSYKVDLSTYGNVSVEDTLNVQNRSSVSGNTLTLQPYSIVVLR